MIKAVIFDLDGVIVSTDSCHYEAWKQMADEEGIPFNEQDNLRLRGVSRMESLNLILEKAPRTYTDEQKHRLAERKNSYYVRMIEDLSEDDLMPGAMETIMDLKQDGIKLAIGSSSKNAPAILRRLGLEDLFDAVADGNQIKHSKPAPDVFLLAAELLHMPNEQCLVVEDADSGVEAALAAGMKVLGVGSASSNQKAHLRAGTLAEIDLVSEIKKFV